MHWGKTPHLKRSGRKAPSCRWINGWYFARISNSSKASNFQNWPNFSKEMRNFPNIWPFNSLFKHSVKPPLWFFLQTHRNGCIWCNHFKFRTSTLSKRECSNSILLLEWRITLSWRRIRTSSSAHPITAKTKSKFGWRWKSWEKCETWESRRW